MAKAEVKPEDNIQINFVEGSLNVLGEKEIEVRGDGNRLHYGMKHYGMKHYGMKYGTFDSPAEYVNFVPLESLTRLRRFQFQYKEIDKHTEARRTLTGGLQVRRKGSILNSTFSRKEFRTIEQYL